MKMRLLFALAALAIGLAVRAFALSGNLAADVKAFDAFNALRMKVGEAFTNNDAAALAALFTEDALYFSRGATSRCGCAPAVFCVGRVGSAWHDLRRQHRTAEAPAAAYIAGKKCRTMEVKPTSRRPL